MTEEDSVTGARSRRSSSSSDSSSSNGSDPKKQKKPQPTKKKRENIPLLPRPSMGCVERSVSRGVVFLAFLCAFALHLAAIIWVVQDRNEDHEERLSKLESDLESAFTEDEKSLVQLEYRRETDVFDVEFWSSVSSFAACQLLNLFALAFLVVETCARGHVSYPMPTVLKMAAPFTLSSAVRMLLEVSPRLSIEEAEAGGEEARRMEALAHLKSASSYGWSYFLLLLLVLYSVSSLLRLWPVDAALKAGWRFAKEEVFCEEGINKKLVRILDTLGSCSALVALVLGLFSIFADQYDLEWEPQGIIKDTADIVKDFQDATKDVTLFLKGLIETLDAHFTCDHLYGALGTGVGVTLVASFFPGAAPLASASTRSSYYYVRAANALTNLAEKLRRSKNTLWQLARAVRVLAKVTTFGAKGILKSSNYGTLARLLPFLPPVVLGMYVLFGSFWPKRILFFSAKQRRKTVAGEMYTWLLAFLALVVAMVINTALVDEIVAFLDENIPLVGVQVRRKLGWRVSAAAFAFAFLSTVAYFISSIILKIQTFTNHENLTNAELDWKYEIEKRELVRIRTSTGDKLEKKTQIKHKKERIGPWTWVLPILLCLIACGFGYMANTNPKFEYQLEPKGQVGRVIERIFRNLGLYDSDQRNVKKDTEMECLPYASFSDFLDENEHVANILMGPVNRFFNKTEELVKPLRDTMTGLRKQLFLDVQEELFGDELNNIWDENNLQYLGLILMAPRMLCLLILIFGCLTASIWVCQMQIIQAVEPRRVVGAYGMMALFSLVYVVGVQLALYNFLTTIGIPFFHLQLRFGLGFVYDLVADFILVSVYVGMKNEFFFAIPKRKVTVTYSVPGVSDGGPNIEGKII